MMLDELLSYIDKRGGEERTPREIHTKLKVTLFGIRIYVTCKLSCIYMEYIFY